MFSLPCYTFIMPKYRDNLSRQWTQIPAARYSTMTIRHTFTRNDNTDLQFQWLIFFFFLQRQLYLLYFFSSSKAFLLAMETALLRSRTEDEDSWNVLSKNRTVVFVVVSFSGGKKDLLRSNSCMEEFLFAVCVISASSRRIEYPHAWIEADNIMCEVYTHLSESASAKGRKKRKYKNHHFFRLKKKKNFSCVL